MNANISALALNRQNMMVLTLNGGTLGFSLTPTSTQVLPANAQVQKITFRNPGLVNIFVCQALDANGNPLTPGENPGNQEIFTDALLIFTGNAGAPATETAFKSGNTRRQHPLNVTGVARASPRGIWRSGVTKEKQE